MMEESRGGVGGLVDRQMKVAIGLDPFGGVGLGRHLLVHGTQTLDQLIGELGDGETQRHRLEDLADHVDLMQFVAAQFLDNRSPVRIEPEEALGGEIAQRLPYRCGAHLEVGGQVGLHEAGAALEVAAEDRPAEYPADELVGGLAGP